MKEVSRDLLTHYVTEILPNGFKAMVVSASIPAACRYKYELEKLIPEFIKEEEEKPEADRDDALLARLKILKPRAVVSMEGNNEEAYITAARKEGQGKPVVEAYRKSFDPDKPETGIGILCVCDRLLTGFDAPIAQVMYLDKGLKEHNLMQAIARVNRQKKDKGHGILVDYFGITKDLERALGIYSDADKAEAENDLKEFGEYFRSLEKEIPELDLRLNKICQFFEDNSVPEGEGYLRQALESGASDKAAVEKIIGLTEDMRKRAELDALAKNYFDRLDLLFNQPDVQKRHWIPAKRLGYLLFAIGQFYKDPTMDLKWASAKVRRLLDKYIRNQSVTENISAVSMLSDDFPKILSKYSGQKSQASAMEHAIRWQIKVDLEDKDPGLYEKFKDRLDGIISRYGNNWDQMIKEFEALKADIDKGREEDSRFKPIQAPFYDCLKLYAKSELTDEEDAKVVRETKNICSDVKKFVPIPNFWEKPSEVRKLHDAVAFRLRMGLRGLVDDSATAADKVMDLCRNNHGMIMGKLNDLA